LVKVKGENFYPLKVERRFKNKKMREIMPINPERAKSIRRNFVTIKPNPDK